MKTLFYLLVLTNLCFAQTYLFDQKLASFSNANSFHINSADVIFVTDAYDNSLIRIDPSGEIKETGGYGTSNESFDLPVDVYASILNVFVCDYNNDRIKMFDRDLNFLSSFYKAESDNDAESFRKPRGCALSRLDDLYILDSDNKRVLKFDLFGNFSASFGNYTSGEMNLTNPTKLIVDNENRVLVLNDNSLFVYDRFGNNLGVVKIDSAVTDINICNSVITLSAPDSIYIIDNSGLDFTTSKLSIDYSVEDFGKIVSSIITKDNLYLLTSTGLLLFKKGS